MALIFGLVGLAGNIALLLWGTRMVQTGIQRAFGPSLRTFLGRALSNRLKSFTAGVGVTAVLQSSTATGLMASGFAAGGLVGLMPALSVMLGANVGTTLIVQVLSFNVAAVYPALILVGFIMFKRNGNPQVHDLGRVIIGLGFMLLALHHLLEILEQYQQSAALSYVLKGVAATPLLSVLLAAILTWAAHSSVAIVLLIMSLATNGLVEPYQAFALVLGANLGTAINPVVEGNSDGDLASKRLPIGNLLTRIAGVLAALAALGPLTSLVGMLDDDPARSVANFHTAFNLVLAVVFMPFLQPYANFLVKMLPRKIDETDRAKPRYLDPGARETPIVALGAAAREALRLTDVLREMIVGARAATSSTDRQALSELRKKDNILDSLTTAIKAYLMSIDPEELGETDRSRMEEILLFSMNLEQAGDVLDQNLLPHLAKRVRRGLIFSMPEQDVLKSLFDRLTVNLDSASALFMSRDERLARLLAEEKVVFRRAERETTAAHFDQIRKGGLDTMETSSLQLDIIRDLKAINSHLVAATAYPVLERQGELLQSRLSSLPATANAV